MKRKKHRDKGGRSQRLVRGLFYGMMPVFLLAGLYSGLRLWYYLLLTQIFTSLLILIVDLWTVYTFCFTQTLSAEEANKGELCTICLSIVNEKPFPLSMMEIEMETVCPADRKTLRMSLSPLERRSFTVPMTLPYRGVYEAGMTRIHITDFFGLFPFSFDMRRLPYYRLPKITVFPRAELPLETAGLLRDSKNAGSHYRNFADTGESPAGAREFTPGDPLKRIHWIKTAQMGRLYTREYEFPRRESLYIFVDNCVSGGDSEDGRVLLDTLSEAAADLTLMGVSSGHPVSVRCVSPVPGHPDRAEAEQPRTFPLIHRMLAEMGTDSDPGHKLCEAVAGLSAREEEYLFVLTGNADRELVRLLREIGGHFAGVTLVQSGGQPVPAEGLHSVWIAPGENVRARLEAIG